MSKVSDPVVEHLDSLANDLELLGPTVELLMSSLVYATAKVELLGEPDDATPVALLRAERARQRLVRALTCAGRPGPPAG